MASHNLPVRLWLRLPARWLPSIRNAPFSLSLSLPHFPSIVCFTDLCRPESKCAPTLHLNVDDDERKYLPLHLLGIGGCHGKTVSFSLPPSSNCSTLSSHYYYYILLLLLLRIYGHQQPVPKTLSAKFGVRTGDLYASVHLIGLCSPYS